MKTKWLRTVFFLSMLGCLLLLTGCEKEKDLSGTWTIKISPTHASRAGCENSFLGLPVTLVATIHHLDIGEARERYAPEEADNIFAFSEKNKLFHAQQVGEDWYLLGEVDGKRVKFLVWMDNCPAPEYCGDTNHFEGTVSGQKITGTYEGGSGVSKYAFNPAGFIEDACTWGGTFTVVIEK